MLRKCWKAKLKNTPGEIKQLYESMPDTNVFTDEEKVELARLIAESTSHVKVKATYFETITSGTTSGTVTKPAGAGDDVSFVLDEWGVDSNALVSTLVDGKPTWKSPVSAGGSPITSTFDADGNFAFSAAPAPAADTALIYVYECDFINFDDDESLFESELIDFEPLGAVATHAALTTGTHGVTGTILGTEDVDDTPVDGADTAPVSSNWAFDHEAEGDHSEIRLTPKASSSGPEGTIFYNSGDNNVYVGVE